MPAYSTAGFRDRDVEGALDAIVAAGFEEAEILGEKPHVADPPLGRAVSEFRARLQARGIRATTVHAPFMQGRGVLAVVDEAVRQKNVAVLGGYVRFAGEIGATDVIVHPVCSPRFMSNPGDSQIACRARSAIRPSLDELVPVAQEAGVRILLENLPIPSVPDTEDFPFRTMAELREVVDEYPGDRVGLVIDTGHAWLFKKDPAKEILAAGPRLHGTHLQDLDDVKMQDSHWVPTHGGLNWDAIRAALAQIQYQGPRTFEVMNARYGESLEELARKTRRVARSWGW
jgi:protein FrlC